MTPAKGMLRLPGVTTMEDRVAGVTVKVVLTEIFPEETVMVAVPAAMAIARPLLLTTTTDGFDELQVACPVISRLIPSEYLPVPLNCEVSPTGMLGLIGVMAMEDRVAEITPRPVFPEKPPKMAPIVTAPAEMAVAKPLPLTTATDGFEDIQVTCGVMS